MTRKAKFIIGVGAALLFACLVVVATPVRLYKPGRSPGNVEQRLRGDLRVGMDKQQVIVYLNNQRMEHSDYMIKQQVIYAIVRDACWGVLLECSVDVELSFDEQGRLSSISVKEGLTGL